MNAQTWPLDPLIEGYLSYLDKVGRKTPARSSTCAARCAGRSRDWSAIAPESTCGALTLEDYLHWLEAERQQGRTASCLAKYLSHVRGLLEYAWRSGRSERNVLDGFSLQHTLRRTAPKSLTLEEAERLVHATSVAGPTRAARSAGRSCCSTAAVCARTSCARWMSRISTVSARSSSSVKAKGDRPRVHSHPGGALHRASGLPARARQARRAVSGPRSSVRRISRQGCVRDCHAAAARVLACAPV